jgi:hypothetical protein
MFGQTPLQTLQQNKLPPDKLFPLFLACCSIQLLLNTARSSSSKLSRTPPRRSLEGMYRRQQDHHLTSYFPIGPPMPRPWGPPSMVYPPCPPWAGWYGPWASSSMPFHPGRSGHAEGFGFGGFYAGDGHYGHVGHQQDRGAPRQENRTVQNAKSDHPVSQGAAAAPGHRHE